MSEAKEIEEEHSRYPDTIERLGVDSDIVSRVFQSFLIASYPHHKHVKAI